MDTKLFYQDHRLYTLVRKDFNCSILRSADSVLAERRTTAGSSHSSLTATSKSGSVLQVCTSGGVSDSLSYSAYGAVPAFLPLLPVLMFNGEWHEPLTGCYPLGNGYRLFNTVLMRFQSADSLSPFGNGGMNAYAYCKGDPINNTDPSGHINAALISRYRAINPRPASPPQSLVTSIAANSGAQQQRPSVIVTARQRPPTKNVLGSLSEGSHSIARGSRRPSAKHSRLQMPPPRNDLEIEIAAVSSTVWALQQTAVSPQQQKALLTAQAQLMKLLGRQTRTLIPYNPDSKDYRHIAKRALELGELSTSSVLDTVDEMLGIRTPT